MNTLVMRNHMGTVWLNFALLVLGCSHTSAASACHDLLINEGREHFGRLATDLFEQLPKNTPLDSTELKKHGALAEQLPIISETQLREQKLVELLGENFTSHNPEITPTSGASVEQLQNGRGEVVTYLKFYPERLQQQFLGELLAMKFTESMETSFIYFATRVTRANGERAYAVLLRPVPGKTLRRVINDQQVPMPEKLTMAGAAGRELAAMQIRNHSKLGKRLETVRRDHMEYETQRVSIETFATLASDGFWPQAALPRTAKLIEQFKTALYQTHNEIQVLRHGDLHDGNMMWNKQAEIIDWSTFYSSMQRTGQDAHLFRGHRSEDLGRLVASVEFSCSRVPGCSPRQLTREILREYNAEISRAFPDAQKIGDQDLNFHRLRFGLPSFDNKRPNNRQHRCQYAKFLYQILFPAASPMRHAC